MSLRMGTILRRLLVEGRTDEMKNLKNKIFNFSLSIVSLMGLLICLAPQNLGAEEIRSNEETTVVLQGRLIHVNSEYGFVVIDLGSKDGVRPGMKFEVYRNGEETGEIQAMKVRTNITAAQISSIAPGAKEMRVNDTVFSIKEEPWQAPVSALERRKPMIRERVDTIERAQPTMWSKITSFFQESIPWRKKPSTLPGYALPPTAEPVAVHINASREAVFFLSTQVLRERGFIITGSQRKEGLLTAQKELPLSLAKEFWADFLGNVGHQITYSVTVTEEAHITQLVIHISAGYEKGEEYREWGIHPSSTAYREAVEVAQTVRERAEGI